MRAIYRAVKTAANSVIAMTNGASAFKVPRCKVTACSAEVRDAKGATERWSACARAPAPCERFRQLRGSARARCFPDSFVKDLDGRAERVDGNELRVAVHRED